jgi:hypothetical protein
MKTLLIFAGLLVAIALLGLACMMLGWYILVPVVIGGLWGIAKELAKSNGAQTRRS